MKHLSQTKQFSKDIKRMARRGKDLEKLKTVVRLLAEGRSLDPRHHDHSLSGQWNQSRDCHIEADWILIYFSDPTSLRLERTGTHSDLFE
jgi:mRNA interferase YafQ